MVNLISVILVLLSSFLGAFGTLLFKQGINRYALKNFLLSPYFFKGFLLYGVSTFFYIIVLRTEDLTFVYPLASIVYLWTVFLSVKYLKEKMNLWKWFGLMGIIVGVTLIGIGS